MAGFFITFEGVDGSGKSTQMAMLVQWLEKQGHSVCVTREPGGTEFGVQLRDIILHSRGFISPRAEALIYAADRAHHIATVVRPALERGDIVVQDRYLDSSVAYQGAGRVLDPSEVEGLSLWATENLLPDLTIVLDVPAELAKQRQSQSERKFDRLEAEALDFHERVRSAYLERAAAHPTRIVVVEGTQPIEQIHQEITQRVAQLLG
jgi:dTMP kinase